MVKEWAGKIRVYLQLKGKYYAFFWISMWKDDSLLCGFMPRMHWTEYGTAITRSDNFIDHTQTIVSGNIDIKKTGFLHISFHPPRLYQRSGVAHVKDKLGFVDKWALDWFPVRKPSHLLSADTGDITNLERAVEWKKPYEIVNVPSNIQYLRMNLVLYPKSPNLLHDPNSITKLIGICPNYIVCCYFYSSAPSVPAFYAAAEI